MVNINKSNKITLLFDRFDIESQNLYQSFSSISDDFKTIVLEDDGFLPEDILSPFTYYLGDFKNCKDCPGKPLYFNQVKVPGFWEIQGNAVSAKVMDHTHERARIFYAGPSEKRLVSIVDWIDESGNVRISEHYNKFGALFCKTVFNKKGQKVNRTFFDVHGLETVHENFVTNTVILTKENKDYFFDSLNDFYLYFLNEVDAGHTNIFYNTLSTSFALTLNLPENNMTDALFWTEDARDDVPLNMQFIFDGKSARTKQIFVQKHSAYEKLIKLGAPASMVYELGYVFDYKRANQRGKDVLICTNSDQLVEIRRFIESCKELHFHILALTEMSSKLLALEENDNVSLYPSADHKMIEKLFLKCNYYLDINKEKEILDSIHQAFLHNMLIFGFQETLHNKNYVSRSHFYAKENVEQFLLDFKRASADDAFYKQALLEQKIAALSCDADEYCKLFYE